MTDIIKALEELSKEFKQPVDYKFDLGASFFLSKNSPSGYGIKVWLKSGYIEIYLESLSALDDMSKLINEIKQLNENIDV